MINNQLINPRSIVVVGGSNSINKPGGKVLYNLLHGNFKGPIYVVNPKEPENRVSGNLHETGEDMGVFGGRSPPNTPIFTASPR